MKHALLLILLCLTIPAWSQITTDSVVGTWVWVDEDNKVQKLVITEDSVTVIAQYPMTIDKKKWNTMSYTGKYTIVNGNTLHVIFWDDPREEQFYEIIKLENGNMTVQLRVPIKKKHGDPRLYRKE